MQNLKFKKARTSISYFREDGTVLLMPNGYRLATIEEVTENWETIKSQGLENKMRLLDGYISKELALCGDTGEHVGCSLISYEYIKKRTFTECNWEIVVKEKEQDKNSGIWKKKSSACYSSTGILLRTKLYDEIDLLPAEMNTALALASIHGDSEVMYWLLKAKNIERFKNFKTFYTLAMPKVKRDKLVLSNYSNMVESLLAFGAQDNQDISKVVDYAIKCIRIGSSKSSGILIVELLIQIYSAESILHDKTNGSLLNVAIENTWIHIMATLFSEYPPSLNIQTLRDRACCGDVLFEAIERGYCQLVEDLSKNEICIKEITVDACQEVAREAVRKDCSSCVKNVLHLSEKKNVNELQPDKLVNTLFHYASQSENGEVFSLLAGRYNVMYKQIYRDARGRNFLHWAALNGSVDDCQYCIDKCKLKVEAKDNLGQNSLHFSAKGNRGHKVLHILGWKGLIHSRDSEGRTPLHLACAKGNLKWVEEILKDGTSSELKKYIEQPDGSGRTALQMAAAGGHKRIVQLILKDCDPLLQRDIYGRTVLHYATQVEDANVAVAILQCLLDKYKDGSDRDKKSLLLWASAAGIGTADDPEKLHPYVKHFLLQEKARDKKILLEEGNNLLRAAARNNNVEMAWELLNRGANIKDIYNHTWKRKVLNIDPPKVMDNVNNVINQIEIEKAQGPDRPSPEDNLGRNSFAEGLASLFLNKFIESPITVGIFGEWGMGKSSLMIQTENILLLAASQLAFPNLHRSEKFLGAENISLNSTGRNIYRKIKKEASKLLPAPEDISEKEKWVGNPLVELLEKYHPQYHAVYKSLACMDLDNQMLSSDVHRKSQFLPMERVPRILTIRYNAWHYRDEHEAWAGLAVTITKEIEQAMTRAQRFSTCLKYSWDKNKVDIYMQIVLPFLLATFLAGWIAWVALTLLKDSKHKDLKYGSIPCTIIAIIWVVLKSVISVVKPVSTQMMGYIASPDHTSRLGYQQQVISDINFLKRELGQKPHWFFRMICGEWCWNWFGRLRDNVENTCIPKFSPASMDKLRIITFVDDLDRCDEKVILQVLSAINLVLAECKINVIVGIDKKVIQRAVRKHFDDNEDRDLAEKFICKIIQIPLSLPDPTKTESERFLKHLLGRQPPRLEDGDQDGEDTDYGDADTDNDVDDEENAAAAQKLEKRQRKLEVGSPDGLLTNFDGIIGKVCCWLAWNLSSKNLNDKEIRPLTFSKGARLTREMVLSNYSPEEVDTLYKLRGFATENQKLPREWKLMLTYRKLACNILSIIGNVHKHPDWKVELVTWIFICWQWKHELNILIKGWEKYAHVVGKDEVESSSKSNGKSVVGEDEAESSSKSNGKSVAGEDEVESSSKSNGKSVAGEDEVGEDEVESSSKSKGKSMAGEGEVESSSKSKGKSMAGEGEVESSSKSKGKSLAGEDEVESSSKSKGKSMVDEDKVEPSLKQIVLGYLNDSFVKNSHDSGTEEEIQTQNNWLNLLDALKVRDVTMEGIQLFKHFRLHCETNDLPWPLPESTATKFERWKVDFIN